MDEAKANKIANDLINKKIGRWTVKKLRGHGKSAVVLKASKGSHFVAVKVFDPDIVERFGVPVQKERINRELLLKGKKHKNLVQIIDGGQCKKTNYLYIVMEYLDWPCLANMVSKVPRNKIWDIVSKIADATKYLEGLQIAHRDIKPENIAVSHNFENIKLLDLGVIRPFFDGSITDQEQREFIGTLRYSSPEYLLREEKDTLRGWRALTFYQIGAVLHDLIMKKVLFEDKSPYAKLVEAVLKEKPTIYSEKVHPELILLANNCLVKNPETRLKILNWNDFYPPQNINQLEEAKKRIMSRNEINQNADIFIEERKRRERLKHIETLCNSILSIVRIECVSSRLFPPIETSLLETSDVNKRAIIITFGQSDKYCLSIPIHVILFLDFHDDNDSSIISIRYLTVLSTAKPDINVNIRKIPTSFFEGVFNTEMMKQELLKLIYFIFDKAQKIQLSGRPLEEVTWMTLN